MNKRFCVMLLGLSLSMLGADATGTWKGSASQDDNGEKVNHPLSIKLVQTGSTVTGATFTETGESLPLVGVVKDNQITLKLKIPSELITFELYLEGTHLKGKLTSQHGAESQTSTLDLAKSVS
jgi:hypothetical protein